MPREVELNVEKMLPSGTTRVELARRLGVSEATVRAYLENRWAVLDRTVLERWADFLQVDASSLLLTSETHFFDLYRRHSGSGKDPRGPACLFLRRPDADIPQGGWPVGYRDNNAVEHVAKLLRDHVDGIAGTDETAATPEEFRKRILQNCIVVGSAMVNRAAEMAICSVFRAEPFAAAQAVRVPVVFRVGSVEPDVRSSVLETASDGKLGIWLREEGGLVEADRWPREEFRKMRIKKARDCAVVMVSNQRIGDQSDDVRKLVVLAGFGGAGTEAAAMALADNFRDLEPLDRSDLVWGVIEVLYSKPANSTTRENLTYNWRYRVGGRRPIDFAKRKS